jgi:hypothetical protein
MATACLRLHCSSPRGIGFTALHENLDTTTPGGWLTGSQPGHFPRRDQQSVLSQALLKIGPCQMRLGGQLSGVCSIASARARSRDLRAGPVQPQVQRARQKEPRSEVVAVWSPLLCEGSSSRTRPRYPGVTTATGRR